MGRKMVWDGEIIEWVEDARIVWQASSGQPKKMQMKAINCVEKEDGNTRYGLKVEYQPPYSILGDVMDVIRIRRTIKRSNQKLARETQDRYGTGIALRRQFVWGCVSEACGSGGARVHMGSRNGFQQGDRNLLEF